MNEKMIEITRNGNKIEIVPDFEKRTIKTVINSKEYRGLKLNDKNQFMSRIQKIGVQLDENQAEQIRKWLKEFESLREQEDQEKKAEIKNKAVKKIQFKFHNYMTERYVHTEHVELSDHQKIYSDEGYEIIDALKSLSPAELEKVGIEREDDTWQEIALSDEDKQFIIETAAINEAETRDEVEKIEKQREEREQREKEEYEIKLAGMREKAVKTGEKQEISTKPAMADDGNLVIITKYVHPNGHISTSEFYDGD